MQRLSGRREDPEDSREKKSRASRASNGKGMWWEMYLAR